MKTILTIIFAFVGQLTFSQSQYQKAMTEALQLWQNQDSELAIAKLERIASVEKENWIPKYYIALIATFGSYQKTDTEQKNILLKLANDNLPQDEKNWNAEWHVVKANILTSELILDPMNNAMRLSPEIIKHYTKAKTLDPQNPRAISGLAIFNINSKRFSGENTDQEYKDLEKALSLFENEKIETPFYPDWGKEQTMQYLNNKK